MLALVLVAVLAGCSGGDARTVPTTIPPVTPKDGRLGVHVAVSTRAGVAGVELAIADLNRAGGVHGHPVRVVDEARADIVIGGPQDDVEVDPVAADDDFLDRLRQVDPSLAAVDEAAHTYAEVRKLAADAKPDQL
jgi:hypothetical protein